MLHKLNDVTLIRRFGSYDMSVVTSPRLIPL